MRQFGRDCLAALLAAVAVSSGASSEARAWSIDGITVVELKDSVATQALGSAGGDYLVTFVSGVGSYAATVTARGDRGCIAWGRNGSNTGTSISFGLAEDEYEVRVGLPSVCLPFTLTFEDERTVRVSAENRARQTSILPQAPPPPIVRYSRKRAVVNRVPLRALDWGLPAFAKHHIGGVRLGPIEEGGEIDYRMSNVRKLGGDIIRSVKATAGGGTGGGRQDTVLGHAAPGELTGWPWEALYAIWSTRRVDPPSTRSALETSIVEAYGQPSFVQDIGGRWFWLYDLDGKPLAPDDAEMENCLQAIELWNDKSLVNRKSDLGPWGCALAMTLNISGSSSGTVSTYHVEILSGYAHAISHFLSRLEELKERRQAIQLIEAAEPEL